MRMPVLLKCHAAVQQRWSSGLRQLADTQPRLQRCQGFESLPLRQRAHICGCDASMSEGLLGFRMEFL
jgi:hypothetical protein